MPTGPTSVSADRRPRTTRARDEDVEQLLGQLLTATDPDARARLRTEVVAAHLPLADGLAHRYVGRGMEREDLEQVARTALVAAVERYRAASGTGAGFVAFAVPTITGELKRHFRDCGWVVRPPRRIQELRSEVAVAEESLRHRHGREATVDELSALLRCDAVDVESARRSGSGFRPVSLDAPTLGGGSEGERLGDGHDEVGRLELHLDLRGAVAGLGERDRRVVRMRFVEERTQAEIGSALGVSQMQVSRILARILADLRGSLAVAAA
ncbi:sigma-70 family RNA polymerase sigma factor [Phycicoccus avicenniae]|uniref:sigma-70 family RNA polymerase sigma factor n=1 Tax=Phycicoccus avicenniae TaxID=2828860 RepID=UPI003D26E816